jgi:hypothetical protein
MNAQHWPIKGSAFTGAENIWVPIGRLGKTTAATLIAAMVHKAKIAIFSRMVFIVSLLRSGVRPRAFAGRYVRVIDQDERRFCAGAHSSTKEFSSRN